MPLIIVTRLHLESPQPTGKCVTLAGKHCNCITFHSNLLQYQSRSLYYKKYHCDLMELVDDTVLNAEVIIRFPSLVQDCYSFLIDFNRHLIRKCESPVASSYFTLFQGRLFFFSTSGILIPGQEKYDIWPLTFEGLFVTDLGYLSALSL